MDTAPTHAASDRQSVEMRTTIDRVRSTPTFMLKAVPAAPCRADALSRARSGHVTDGRNSSMVQKVRVWERKARRDVILLHCRLTRLRCTTAPSALMDSRRGRCSKT